MLRRDARRETRESPNEAKRRPRGCLRRLLAFGFGAFAVLLVLGLLLGAADTYLWRRLNWPMPFGNAVVRLSIANMSGRSVRIDHLRLADKMLERLLMTGGQGVMLETYKSQNATKWMIGVYALPKRYRFPVEVTYTELDTGKVRRGVFTADRRPARGDDDCAFGLDLTPEGPALTACHPVDPDEFAS